MSSESIANALLTIAGSGIIMYTWEQPGSSAGGFILGIFLLLRGLPLDRS